MQRIFITLTIIIIIVLGNIASTFWNGNEAMSHGSGAPAAYTGSPGDGHICTSCHAGPTPATQTGWITSNIPVSGYVPNTTYTITATATRSNHSKFGFEISPQNVAGTLRGTLVNTSTQTQLVGSSKYITHTSSGTTGTSGFHTWSFNWTAPAAGSGAVTFYGAFCITNSSNSSSGDTIYKSTLVVQEVIPPVVGVSINNHVTCNGGNDGSATATASSGTSPYSYSWNSSPVQNTSTATGLPAGTYIVTVTDANTITATATVTITQPTAITASVTFQTNVSCYGGNDGSATVTASGGTGTLGYSWNSSPVQNTVTATGLTAGNYTVTVTDANGCTKTANVSITQPPALTVSISPITDVTCNGGNNGSATANATGGTGTLNYSWNTSPIQNTAIATGLTAGFYTVTVTDANGCTKAALITIAQPAAIIASVTSQTNVSCNGGNNGSAIANATGGTGPLSYSWNTSPVQNSAAATGLSAGSYAVTVTDANGCTKTSSVTITQPPVITASVISQTNVNCNGGNNGSATANATGGTGTLTYSWNTTLVQNTAAATGLTAGSYVVTVTDANGCTKTASVSITQPPAITASISSQTNVHCNGGNNGNAIVIATGGTGTLGYSWNTIPVQNTATATGLTAGSYTVTVTDANGCTKTASVTITQPPVIIASVVSQTNVNCNGGNNGSATANATGGTGALSYSWNTSPVQNTAAATGLTAGSYTVTITDANGCTKTASALITQPTAISLSTSTTDASCGNNDGTATATASGGTGTLNYSWNTVPIQNTVTATGLLAGTYIVTITDANGCTKTATANVSNSGAPTVTIFSQSNVTCSGGNNGSAAVSVNGGTFPFTYSWNTAPVQTTSTVTGLSEGIYEVTVTDNAGCVAIQTVTITAQSVISILVSQTNVSCNGGNNGTATATVSGGTGSLTYSWNTTPVQYAYSAAGLSAGNYTVTVTDSTNCSNTSSINITEPSPVVVNVSSATSVCFGSCVGLTCSASGGYGSFRYSWQPTGDTLNAILVCPGSLTTYIATATDSAGCTGNNSSTVTVHSLPFVSVDLGQDTTCINAASYLLTGGIPAGGIYSGYGVIGGYFSPSSAGTGMHAIAYLYSDLNGCENSDTALLYVDACTGIQPVTPGNFLTIYPNPNSGLFSVEFNTEGYELTVLNLLGEIVFIQTVENKKTDIDLSNEQSGIYFLQLKTGEGILSKRFQIYK